ncbi:MAG: PaaI family thioesterase [Candidatus Binatia bacterium]
MTPDEIVTRIPYARLIGIEARASGEGWITHLTFRDGIVGNRRLPAIHGGVVGAFLEMAALVELIHQTGGDRIPKPINFNINFLRSAGPLDSIARAEVVKLGKRIAHVRVIAWQDDPERPVATGYGNFLV